MNQRDNLLSLLRRQGFQEVPVEFQLCPALVEEYERRVGKGIDYADYFEFPTGNIEGLKSVNHCIEQYLPYYSNGLNPGTHIDTWGVAHEPGSAAAMHMTRMLHPLEKAQNIEEIIAYPFPDYQNTFVDRQRSQVMQLHAKGKASVGSMQCTIWETAWYLRSMNELMMDMMTDHKKAEYLLDKVTEIAVIRASAYAAAGVDILYLGDDIGMQKTIMMSEGLYCTWLKPRLKQVIDAAKAVKPDLIVFYHSCGYVTPLIPHLIEAGIDVLNPIQPECMDFREIHDCFGDRISFHGSIGTQTTMPFGTPEEVRRKVIKNLDIAGSKGGLFISPTHMLEPEVPWENVVAYLEACRDYFG